MIAAAWDVGGNHAGKPGITRFFLYGIFFKRRLGIRLLRKRGLSSMAVAIRMTA
jgi:hypothetical protein